MAAIDLVLGRFLFTLDATLLRSHLFALPLNHNLYVYDAQLFISFQSDSCRPTKTPLAFAYKRLSVSLAYFCSLDSCNSMFYCLPLARAVVAGPPIPTIFSNRCTSSTYMNALNTKLIPIHLTSSSLLHVRPARSHHSTCSLLGALDHLHWLLFSNH